MDTEALRDDIDEQIGEQVSAAIAVLQDQIAQGSEITQWDELKHAAAEAVHSAGGTVTHHHAVGKMHRPQYDRQMPGLFLDAYKAAKADLDPGGILNPGVLIDP